MSNMNDSRTQPLVTVVTPVYNGEAYIRECIESVLSQTYSNWELFIINNCSKDKTLEIAREYAAKDGRIRIVDNPEFLRVIANHNAAMRMVSPDSKYCKVVFADDWLFPECLEKMVSLAEQNPQVGIISSYRLYGAELSLGGLPYKISTLTGREICRAALMSEMHLFGTATSLLLRSDLVRARSPFYNESNLHADTEVCFELLKTSDFGFVHQVLTFTRAQEGTLTSFSRSRRTYLAGFLGDLAKFGPYYLNPGDFNTAVNAHLEIYYRYLGRSVFERRGRDFWAFHRQKLQEVGFPFSRARVARSAVRRALDVALGLNYWPYMLFKRLRRLVSRGPKPIPAKAALGGPAKAS
jgi:glycosyltransferase involved in cell wall biosynthesis